MKAPYFPFAAEPDDLEEQPDAVAASIKRDMAAAVILDNKLFFFIKTPLQDKFSVIYRK